MKKINIIGICALFLVVMAMQSYAETRPARGYLQDQTGMPIQGESVFVVVKVHSNTDYPCFCNSYEVFSSSTGEFVSDFGNLYYLGDCTFWKKKDKDPCYNDWMQGDIVLVKARGELRESRSIDREPIFEIGYMTYPTETASTGTTTVPSAGSSPPKFGQSSLSGLKEEVQYAYNGINLVSSTGINIDSIGVGIVNNSYNVIVKVDNPTPKDYTNLDLQVVAKDIEGQVSEVLWSSKFSISNQSSKEILVPWDIDSGIYSLSSTLNEESKIVSASKEIQVVFDRTVLQDRLVLERPQNTMFSWYFGIILGLIILLLIIVLSFEILNFRNQKKGSDKK